jgi:integrase
MTEIIVSNRASDLVTADLMHQAGQAANKAAARSAFSSYAMGKAKNTLRRHAGDLEVFRQFLQTVHIPTGDLMNDPEAWRGITWGLVDAFRRWMLKEGYAVSTVNFRLSTVKVYARQAGQAGVISIEDVYLIEKVNGFAHKQAKHINEEREEQGQDTRRRVKTNGQKSTKKAEAVSITPAQAKQLKAQPDTPQGRRDAALMCILLDHGLRCGEVAGLQAENFDLKAGTMTFYRPKVDMTQTHKLTTAALRAVKAYLETDHPLLTGPFLLASRKGGKRGAAGGQLAGAGMCERTITERVRYLGKLAGITGLSAHDCRHYWATQAARNGTHMERLKDAGGWSSLAMPARYIEAAAIANEGVNLGAG